MTLPWQQLLVAPVVAACALYSVWRLLTPRARLRTLASLARLPGAAHAAWLGRLRARALAQSQAGCGACGGKVTPVAPARNRTPGALRR